MPQRPHVALIDDQILLGQVEGEGPPEDSNSLSEAIVQNWTRLAFSGLSGGTYARLRKLASKAPEWRGSGSKPLSGASLRYFLEFWKLVREDASEPELALAPNGNLQVEWHKNWRKHLDLEFSDNGLAYFGLFDGKSILEGVEFGRELADTLMHRSSKPLRWISQ